MPKTPDNTLDRLPIREGDLVVWETRLHPRGHSRQDKAGIVYSGHVLDVRKNGTALIQVTNHADGSVSRIELYKSILRVAVKASEQK